MSSVAFAEKFMPRESTETGLEQYRDVPAMIRAHLNADADRDVLVRMQDLARKRRSMRPGITEQEMADYLALAENCENFEHWLKFRRETATEAPGGGTIAWVLGVLAVVALLTTGLITAIAVSVSGL